MMFFQDAQYPRCAAFMRTRFEMLELFSPKIYQALVACIEAEDNEALVKQALAADTYPRVKIVRLMHNGFEQKNVGGLYSGECNPKDKNYV